MSVTILLLMQSRNNNDCRSSTKVYKVKRGYFERRVIPYCSNISEATQASELNVGGYNLP